jgi:hypothetical protein
MLSDIRRDPVRMESESVSDCRRNTQCLRSVFGSAAAEDRLRPDGMAASAYLPSSCSLGTSSLFEAASS